MPAFLGLTFVPVWATHFRADNAEVVVPQGTDGVHFLCGQDKIEQLDVFFDFREFQRSWEDSQESPESAESPQTPALVWPPPLSPR